MNSFYTGLLKHVGLYYLDVSFGTDPEKKTGHSSGLVVHSEYETELLKRSRVYFRYAWQTSISENLKLSAGASLGFFNYTVRGTSSSGDISAFAPTGDMGLWLHGKKFNTGLSFDQFLRGEITPVNNTFILARYAVLLADRRFTLSDRNSLLFAVKTYLGEENFKGAQGTVLLTLAKHFAAGFFYRHRQGGGFTIGLKELKVTDSYGDLSFTYFQPSSSLHVLNSNRMEIMLRAFLDTQK
jgi:hypothetical protein